LNDEEVSLVTPKTVRDETES